MADDIIEDAKTRECRERSRLITQWANEGHLHVTDEGHHHDELWICLQSEIFKCKRVDWPSAEIVAKLALAIAAGRSDRNEILDRDVAEPNMQWRGFALTAAVTRRRIGVQWKTKEQP